MISKHLTFLVQGAEIVKQQGVDLTNKHRRGAGLTQMQVDEDDPAWEENPQTQ